MNSISIIDDNVTLRRSLELSLIAEGFEVYTSGSGTEGLRIINAGMAEVVLLDLKLPDMDGLNVLREIRRTDNFVTVIVITAHGNIESAVEAMKLGADDYLTKPFEIDEIILIIERAFANINLKNQLKRNALVFDKIVGCSREMNSVFDIVSKITVSNSTTVLLEGETGTGKGLIARLIHEKSSRWNNPFVELNCSSLPLTLAESELFGHEIGAFTDARKLKKGLIEQADSGTLFLDEIADLDPMVQVKILKVIEEKKIRRIGGLKDITCDIRIVAATNRNLKELVDRGDFRKDLFYRLNVIPLRLPPLRERKSDIPLITEYFLKKYSLEFKKKQKVLSIEASHTMMEYEWPGNVRELKNVIERICLLEDSVIIEGRNLSIILDEGVSQQIRTEQKGSHRTLEEMENRYISEVINFTDNNKSEAAKILGISRQTLRKKMQP